MHLVPFPGTTAPFNLSGSAFLKGPHLQIQFILNGPLSLLKKIGTTSSTKNRKNELWKSTCFEWFIKTSDHPRYWEFNLSPNGDWNVYSLTDYRQNLIEENLIRQFNLETKIISDKEWHLEGFVDLSAIPALSESKLLLINLSAVLELQDSSKTYWSLAHTQKQPDFHHPQHFLIQLTKES